MLRADDPFTYQKPGPIRTRVHADTNAAFKALYGYILQSIPDSRERSLAITNLEQAAMWANKAIAFHIQEAPTPDEVAK